MYIPQPAVMTAVLLHCIIVYFASGVGLPLCFERREILIVVIFCPFRLRPIALPARIAMSGFFRTELILERCSLDICKDWGRRPITRLLPPNTHEHKTHTNTNTHEHTDSNRTADSHIDIFGILQGTQTNSAQRVCRLEVRCGAVCTVCRKSP